MTSKIGVLLALAMMSCAAGADDDNPSGDGDADVGGGDTGGAGGTGASGGGGSPGSGGAFDDDDDLHDPDGDGYDNDADCGPQNPTVNPGALEIAGDAVDNDCDGQIDESPATCDTSLALDTSDAMDLARAMGLCDIAQPGQMGVERRWGVLSAKLETTDGIGAPWPRQYAVQSDWGDMIGPRVGANMAVLSSGVARTPGQPEYIPLPKGTDSTTNVNTQPPGFPKNAADCPVPQNKLAHDPVVLTLGIRVPTNVNALSFDFKFYTSEYVEYVCQAYNDSFIALLDTTFPLDPTHDGNISFGEGGNPINVNSAFFEACSPDSWLGHSFTCPLGTTELGGTGFDAVPSSLTSPAQNGATDWLTTTAPVVPGEEITLRFMIWNVGDHWLPSSVLLDDFRWQEAPIDDPVTEPPH